MERGQEKAKESRRKRKGPWWTALRVVRGLALAYVVVCLLGCALQSTVAP